MVITTATTTYILPLLRMVSAIPTSLSCVKEINDVAIIPKNNIIFFRLLIMTSSFFLSVSSTVFSM